MKTRLLLMHFSAFLLLLVTFSVADAQQPVFAGLRGNAQQGQFNAIQCNASGDIYLLLNQSDGIRVLEFDPTATTVLAQSPVLGARGDIGLAMALDGSGNVYVTGTTSSGTLAGTSGVRFPAFSGNAITSFIAKFSSNLTPVFVTFTGGSRMTASAIAISSDAIYITGSIFAATLPVTANGIQQSQPPGTMQNGFVEKFSLDGASLLYATYLGGENGYTAPAAIAVDNIDDAYVAGYTTATGYPTLNALVPELIDTPSINGPVQQSGFLSKLTPAGDGFLFSTFLSGSGITAIALDAPSSSLYLAGGFAPGQFPVTNFAAPVSPSTYQGVLKMTTDGSNVNYSSVVAAANASTLAIDGSGNVWITGQVASFLWPQSTLADVGNGYAIHLDQQGDVLQTVRFGGLPTSVPSYYAASINPSAVTIDNTGNALVAGNFQILSAADPSPPVQYDLPLLNAPTTALPSTVNDLVPTVVSCGSNSQCLGYGGYLEKIATADGAALAVSTNTLPNLMLRNIGSADAENVQLNATGYTLNSDCSSTVSAGSACSIALTGNGPGTLTIQSSSLSQPEVISLPANTANVPLDSVAFAPREIDFGIVSSASNPATRTITVTNLTTQSQSFASALDQSASTSTGYSFFESSSDCTLGATTRTKVLAPGGSCTITLGFRASSNAQDDGLVQALWKVGTRDVLLTADTQAAGLSGSSSELDFGTQFAGGLRLPRYLYLANYTDTAIAHTAVGLPANSPFTVIDRCPGTLLAGMVCQIEVDYLSSTAPSADSAELDIDGTLTVLLTGQTLPQPTVSGIMPNPALGVSPAQISFADPVTVTAVSSESHSVQIQNAGTTAFSLSLAIAGDFTLTSTTCGNTLAAGASCTASINFAPSQAGLRQGLLSITASGGSAAYVNLSGTGNGIVSVNNGTLNFGLVPIGQPSVQWVKLNQPLTSITATTAAPYGVVLVEDQGYGHGQPPTSAFQSSVTSTCNNCWLGIEFQPTTAGAQPELVQLSTIAGGNAYLLAVTGTGIPLTTTYLTPASTDFGPIPLHSSSQSYSFTLINGSTQAAIIHPPAFIGDFSLQQNNCPATLAAGTSCTLQVQFAPTALGPRTGSISIPTSIATASASLTGYGSPDPGVAFNPSGLVFNNVADTSAQQQSITVRNTSSTTLQIGALSASNTQFTATTSCTTLSPAASCTILVRYTPSNSLASGTLLVPVSSNGNITNYSLPLSATYTAEDAGLSITPAAMDYGPISTTTSGGTRVFTISNLTSKSIVLNLNLPRQFVLVGAPCSGLAPYANCNVAVQFLPLTNGDITGSILALGTPTDNSGAINGLAYLQGYGAGSSSLAITGSFQPTGALDFGLVTSGQSQTQMLTLTNRGQTSLHIRRITSEPPFFSTTTCGAEIATNATCTVTVRYAPVYQYATSSTPPAPQAMTGSLIVESDAFTSPDVVNLTGTATAVAATAPDNSNLLASFSLSQNSLSFATVSVGTNTAPQQVTLSNTGTNTLHIRSLQSAPDFILDNGDCMSAIAPEASCTFSVSFAPQSTGQRISAVQISSDSSSALEFVSLVGTATPAALAISPSSLNFNTVTLGSTATLPVQINNTSSTAITFLGLSATGDYAVDGNCPASGNTLAAGATCTAQITFQPAQAGTRTGTLSLASSATSLPLSVALTGIGAQGQLQISATQLNFGSVLLGQAATQTIQLQNTGTAPVLDIQTTVTGDFTAANSCTGNLNPGDSCSLNITFTPTAAGSRDGTLTIASSDPKSPTTIVLSGSGISQTPQLQVSASILNFSSTLIGQSATQALTIKNIGNATLSNLATSITGDFAVTTGCASTTLAPGAACNLILTFTPTTSGFRNGTLTITSSDPNSPATVLLNGTGIAGGAFTLAIANGSSPSATIQSGATATYSISVTPINGYQGVVTLGCSAQGSVPYALCAALPISLTLQGSSTSNATVAINTITQATQAKAAWPRSALAFCLLLPAGMLLGTRRKHPRAILWIAAAAATLITMQGCGGGGNPLVRSTPPGTYNFQVTASSTNGIQLTESVQLTLVVK